MSAERCMTPKRCCSSVMTSPRPGYSTFSVNSACVPTRRSISCRCSASRMAFFSPVRMEPVSRHTRRPKGERSFVSVWACCCARISVGAIKADTAPFFAQHQISAAATSVFPEPTSPCTSLFIALPEVKSFSAS